MRLVSAWKFMGGLGRAPTEKDNEQPPPPIQAVVLVGQLFYGGSTIQFRLGVIARPYYINLDNHLGGSIYLIWALLI